jgi:hypothetical protein
MKVASLTLFTATCLSLAAEEFSINEFTQPQIEFVKPRVIKNSIHNVIPRFFFKKHKEGAYEYDMFGFGIGYHHLQREGLNFKCAFSTNIDTSKPYVENDLHIGYSIIGNGYFKYCPYLASKNATHQIKKEGDVKYVVTKGSLYTGLSLKPSITSDLDTEIKIGLSRDLYNVLLHSTDEKFVGRKFSNPFGYIGEISIGYKVIDRLNVILDGSFARGFKGEFRNFGGSLSCRISF